MRKTLTSLLVGASLLLNVAKAEVINVPVYTYGADYQTAIDNAQNGDTINFIRGNESYVWINANVTDKNLTFTSTDGIYFGASGDSMVNTYGTANVTLSGLNIGAEYKESLINTFDNSSLTVTNCYLSNGINYISKNSSGDLKVVDSKFDGTEWSTQSSVVVNNTQGNIDIIKNQIGWNMNPIVINGSGANLQSRLDSTTTSTSTSTLNILNNTIAIAYDAGLTLNGTITSTGDVANNIIYGTPDAVRTEGNAEGLYFDHNNYFETTPLTLQAYSKGLTSTSNIGQNYSFDPLLQNAGYSDSLDPSSQAYVNGININGKTTYFNGVRPYIGSNGDYAQAIPEISTVKAVGLGMLALGGLMALKHRKKARLNDYLTGKGKDGAR